MTEIVLCGVRIDNVTFDEAIERIAALAERRRPSFVVTPNVDHLMIVRRDPEFREIYSQADLVLADGMPLLWAAAFLGTPLRAKVSGSDLVPELCRMAARRGFSIFLLGGREGAADKARGVLEKSYPGIRIAGTHCPPFGFEKNEEETGKIRDAVRRANPDILLVGLGAPKQEKWIHRHSADLGVPVSIGVGVTFEFIAGMVRRAPRWMQNTGLEWFWRLIMEPKRLWRRYLLEDLWFFWLVARQKFGRHRRRTGFS